MLEGKGAYDELRAQHTASIRGTAAPPFFNQVEEDGAISVFKNLKYLKMCANEQMEILASLLGE